MFGVVKSYAFLKIVARFLKINSQQKSVASGEQDVIRAGIDHRLNRNPLINIV